MPSLKNIISTFNKQNILVIGDIILDRYIQGSVSRISPEAPVPIVLEENSFYTPGGATNVANNLCALGAKVTQVGKTGNDFEGQLLKRYLKKSGVDISGIFIDAKVPTVTKTRVIAKHQQIVRIDKEKVDTNGDRNINKRISDYVAKNIFKFDAVIISDYGKGLITPELVSKTCELAVKHKKVITVDPKVEHFCYYKNVTAITPNKVETENAIRNIKITNTSSRKFAINKDKLTTMKDIEKAGQELLEYLDLESLLMTLSEQGMKLFQKGKRPVTIKTEAQEVFDVSGAGDTVISVFTLALTSKATKKQAAELANTAAGIVVGKMGAVAITKDELLEASKGR